MLYVYAVAGLGIFLFGVGLGVRLGAWWTARMLKDHVEEFEAEMVNESIKAQERFRAMVLDRLQSKAKEVD